MINKDVIKKIGEKEMDRKDFLKYGGLAIVAVAGLKTVVNYLSDSNGHKVKVIETTKQVSRGFGGGKYGV